ncbi:hypothetical protein JCM10450v2_007581 [Rhodotorula kratochvilovae]
MALVPSARKVVLSLAFRRFEQNARILSQAKEKYGSITSAEVRVDGADLSAAGGLAGGEEVVLQLERFAPELQRLELGGEDPVPLVTFLPYFQNLEHLVLDTAAHDALLPPILPDSIERLDLRGGVLKSLPTAPLPNLNTLVLFSVKVPSSDRYKSLLRLCPALRAFAFENAHTLPSLSRSSLPRSLQHLAFAHSVPTAYHFLHDVPHTLRTLTVLQRDGCGGGSRGTGKGSKGVRRMDELAALKRACEKRGVEIRGQRVKGRDGYVLEEWADGLRL